MHQSNSDWRPPDPQSEGAEGNRVTGLRAALAALGPQELLQEAGVVHGGVAAAPAVVGAPRGPRPPQAGVEGCVRINDSKAGLCLMHFTLHTVCAAAGLGSLTSTFSCCRK